MYKVKIICINEIVRYYNYRLNYYFLKGEIIYEQTGIKVGFKPAGGINCVNDALIYYTIVKEVLGDEWLTNKLFRLGTSRLANLLLSEIVGEDLKFF